MIDRIKNLITNLSAVTGRLSKLEREITEQKILCAKTLINSFDYSKYYPLSHYEFKVFSQFGDDGIIQYLINSIDLPQKTFIEFGVENYTEANTLFLLLNNNWSGFVMDGSKYNMDSVKKSELYWKFDLKVEDVFITVENINGLISKHDFLQDVGILSIDIDGNDYWVWQSITTIKPVIVIAEYNSVFGADKPWTIAYKPDFLRGQAHFSNLYYGSSLLSLCNLADSKGYFFVGCNTAGNNSYFIRKDKIGPLKPLRCDEGYVLSKFKESRNEQGDLNYLNGSARLELLKGLPVFNTQTNKTEIIS